MATSTPNRRRGRKWHNIQEYVGKDDLTAAGREDLLYQLADIYPPMVVAKGGAVSGVARSMGGTLTTPPVDLTQIRQYFGNSKGFRHIDKLIEIRTKGVPVLVVASITKLDRSLHYGNHHNRIKHPPNT